MNKKIIPIGIISVLFGSIILSGTAYANPQVSLPSEYVTMNAAYGTDSWFEMTLSNVPGGYDITNGVYLGWCIQKSVSMTKNVNHSVVLYSSYASDIPQDFQNVPWDKMNYVINHKIGSRESIEKVFWYYTGEDEYPSNDVDAVQMITAADANGTSFVPAVGQMLAVLVVGVESIQRTFLELTIPSHQSSPGSPPSRPKNSAPTADGTAGEPYTGFVGEEIVFDGSRSYDRDGSIVSFTWLFEDGTSKAGAVVSHSFDAEGIYTVSLTVRDNHGAADTYTTKAVIKLGNYPPKDLIIYGPSSGTKNTVYDFTAAAVDPDGNDIVYTFSWGTGAVVSSEAMMSGQTCLLSNAWSDAGLYIISVVASDGQAVSETVTQSILIDAVFAAEYGYMVDSDGDDIYDGFYSNVTKGFTTISFQNGGGYLLDVSGNGVWEYVFDPAAGGVSVYQGDLFGPATFVFVALIIVFGLILGYSIVKTKKSRKKTNGGNVV